ncbi:carboxyl transferase domain-containing protein [Streptomyces sp. NPDC101151]|uniref:carboxyl transferase domain-containing protein n=1 Tax=Streptomyces sp. NPDC101151 TaxID=3366115 RepID=UPI00380E06DB
MAVLRSHISPSGEVFRRNSEAYGVLRERIAAARSAATAGGGADAQARHAARGKLTARERVTRLLDPGTPFLEICQLAAHEVYEQAVPSAGIITGVGMVEGRPTVVFANDATVKGGTYYPLTVRKHLRAQQVARENGLPCIYLVDSGGVFLPMQEDIFARPAGIGSRAPDPDLRKEDDGERYVGQVSAHCRL